MAKQDNVIDPTTPEGAGAFFKTEQERYARLVEEGRHQARLTTNMKAASTLDDRLNLETDRG